MLTIWNLLKHRNLFPLWAITGVLGTLVGVLFTVAPFVVTEYSNGWYSYSEMSSRVLLGMLGILILVNCGAMVIGSYVHTVKEFDRLAANKEEND